MDFKPGDTVLFFYNGKKYYRKITKIVMTSEGLCAQFDPGCACEVITVPLNILYKDVDEFKKNIRKEWKGGDTGYENDK